MRATALLAVLLVAGMVAGTLRLADSHYRRAERDYQAGDFERAALGCERALRARPGHVPAAALLAEIRFILGVGTAVTPDERYQRYFVSQPPITVARMLNEMDDALDRGERTGDEREWRKILEYAKWVPDVPEVRERRDRARACLDRVSGPAASAR